MAYNFKCVKCNSELSTESAFGNIVSCKSCGTQNAIPNNTFKTDMATKSSHIRASEEENQPFTITILKSFAVLDLIAGFVVGIYYFINFGYIIDKTSYTSTHVINQYAIIISVSLIFQGIFAFAICNAIVLGLENLFKINNNLEKLAKK